MVAAPGDEGAGRATSAPPAASGVRVGSMMFTGEVLGYDPATGRTPDDIDQQIANCFANLGSVLTQAGGSIGDVGQVTVFVRDNDIGSRVNPVWLTHFPDERTRPMRQTILETNLGYAIRLEGIAVLKG